MPRYKPIYPYSRREAERTGELNLWSESYAENCTCARDIDRAIADGYGDNRLDRECAKKVISEYGYDRVNWILANTIREGEHDGRYSRENKEWAKRFSVPKDENFSNMNFALRSHPGLVDIFTDLVRKAWQNLGLYEADQCYPEKMDLKGKIVAIRIYLRPARRKRTGESETRAPYCPVCPAKRCCARGTAFLCTVPR